jgi:hypothetical protein
MAEHGKEYPLQGLAKSESDTLKTWAEARDESEWSGPDKGLLHCSDLPGGIDNLLNALNKAAEECGIVRPS